MDKPNNNKLKKKISEQRVQLKRLNRAIVLWHNVAELATHHQTKLFNEKQELYEQLCKEQNNRCPFCNFFRKYK